MDLNLRGRIPPQNKEAEQSVLGAILLNQDLLNITAQHIKPEDFYFESHRLIYDAMYELSEEGQPIDLVTVMERLQKKDNLDLVGGVEFLSELTMYVPTTANTEYYTKIVADKSTLRKLIQASGEISEISFNANDETDIILNSAEKKIFDISQAKKRGGLVHISEVMEETFAQLESLFNNTEELTGIPSGFRDLDKVTAGFQKSDLVLIAARPGMGKTSFILNIAYNAASMSKTPIAIFNLEMSKDQLVKRIISSESLVGLEKMRTGDFQPDDWKKLIASFGPISETPIYIDDNANTNVMEILSKCRRLKSEKDVGLIIIDYIQLMQGSRRSESRQQEISEISRSLKIMAKELNTPVLALSQLSRAPEQRADHRPMLSDLRDSGAIEQDADIVMFLYRDDYYHEDSEEKNVLEVILSKHRNGTTGTVKLAWLNQFTRFADLAPNTYND